MGPRLKTNIKTGGPILSTDLTDLFISFASLKHQTNVLTAWSRDLLEKLTGPLLDKKVPSLYGARRFVTAFTRPRQNFITW
jgi:hypothetical protein